MIQQDSKRVAQKNLLNPRPDIQVLHYCIIHHRLSLLSCSASSRFLLPSRAVFASSRNFFEPQGPRHLFPLLPRANIQRDEHKETSLRTIYVLQLQVFPVRLSYHTTTITSISVVSDKNQENKHPQVSIENQASDRSSSLNLPPNRRGEMRDVFAIPISCPYMYLFLILRGTYAHTHALHQQQQQV